MAVDEMMTSSMEEEEKLEALSPLVIDINNKFNAVTNKRSDDEDRWLQAYHNYRGKYYKDIHFTEHENYRCTIWYRKISISY